MYFLIEGQKVPQIGVIRMNCCLVDLTDIKANVQVGTEVVIFGMSQKTYLPIEDQANKLSMTCYELLTSVGSHLVRVPIEKEVNFNLRSIYKQTQNKSAYF